MNVNKLIGVINSMDYNKQIVNFTDCVHGMKPYKCPICNGTGIVPGVSILLLTDIAHLLKQPKCAANVKGAALYGAWKITTMKAMILFGRG